MVVISACACSSVTPGFNRATTSKVMPVAVRCFLWRESNRDPQLIIIRGKLKTRRHYAHNRVAFIVERKHFADDSWIATKSPLPQTVTQHRDSMCARLIFGGRKHTTDLRIHTEQRKQIRRNFTSFEPFRIAYAGEIES